MLPKKFARFLRHAAIALILTPACAHAASQTIFFLSPSAGAAIYGTTPVPLVATASSGLPVSFAVVSGPATINGSTLTPNGIGTVIVRASQIGSSNYDAAPNVDRNLTVYKATIAIDLSGLSLTYDGTAHDALASLQGVVTTYSGTAGSPGSLDGTGAAARFNLPQDTAVDSAGNVYVADSSNHIIRKITPAGVVTTLAGTALNPGDTDATGAAARFYVPQGVAVDALGNVYVADSGNHTIRKITPAGVVTTLAGSPGVTGSADGVGSAAQFDQIRDLAVDGVGNVYVADVYNHTIRKITPAGVVTTFAGLAGSQGSLDSLGGGGGAARFSYPNSVAVDAAGQVYVADFNNSTIRKITPLGEVTTLAGSPGSVGSVDETGAAARFSYPSGVAVDNAGNAYVTDGVGLIRKIMPGGVVTTLAGDPNVSTGSSDGTGAAARFLAPQGLSVDSGGTIYVADTSNYKIRKVTPDGVVTTFAGALSTQGSTDGMGGAAQYAHPWGLAMDGAGNLYVADWANGTIRKISPEGVVSTFAGTAGNITAAADGTGGAAAFRSPAGLAIDDEDNVYVADPSDHTIRKITPAGAVTTLAGTHGTPGSKDGPGAEALFNNPSALALDGAGNVYVTDTYNYTIRKITPNGVVTTFAGTPGLAGAVDGTGATVRFGLVQGVTLDSSGNVYVADTYNDMIRKITPGGVVTTLAGALSFRVGSAVDGKGTAARFYRPTGLAVDHSDNVYVADTANQTLRKITPDGFVTTIAGSAGLAASTDGAGSNARFYSPMGVAVDPAGNVYVSDGYGNIIRKVTGVSGAVTVTYNGSSTAPTDAGTYAVLATLNDASHTGTASGTLVISKASTTFALSSAGFTYTGSPQGPTINSTPGNATFTAGGTLSATIAGNYTATASATGNYSGSNSALNWIIAKAAATVTLTGLATTWDGNPKPATVTTNPAGLPVVLTYNGSPNVPSLPGLYLIGATISDNNYQGSAGGALVITDNGPVITGNSAVRHELLPGGTLNLSVTAIATGSPAYQWFHDGRLIAGATGSSLIRSNVAYADRGAYWVVISNAAGSTRSVPMFAVVAPSQTQIRGWGDNIHGVLDVPVDLTRVTDVETGEDHALALRADGTVAAWGNAAFGATAVPAGLTDVVAIAAGATFSVALKSDGTVVAWGDNSHGSTTVPAGLSQVVAISAGWYCTFALKADGTVVAWGDPADARLTLPGGLTDVVSISAGTLRSAAVKRDGTVVAWGNDSYGLLGAANALTGIRDIAGGLLHFVTAANDGTVHVLAPSIFPNYFAAPFGLSGVVAVKTGYIDAIAIKSDGTLRTWGGDSGSPHVLPFEPTDVLTADTFNQFSLLLRDASHDAAPDISYLSESRTLTEDSELVLGVTASGANPLNYQWRKNGVNIDGATSFLLTLPHVALTDRGNYDVVVTNHRGTVTSAMITVAINTLPTVNSDFNGDGHPDIVLQNLTTGARSVRLMNGTTLVTETALGTLAKEWSIATMADFDGDRQPDLLLQNAQTGERSIRMMNGTTAGADVSLGSVPVEWSIGAAADFNGDGKPDILWQNTTTGERSLWFMNGTAILSGTSLGFVPVEWSIGAAADFNGDGKPDILWQNTTTGERSLWFMNGTTFISGFSLGSVPVEWSIGAAADFNGDGKADILWQNTTTGQCAVWFMDGTTILSGANLSSLPAGWSLVGVPTPQSLVSTHDFDFNGDGHPDILWQNTATGERSVWFMNGPTIISGTSLGFVPVEWSIGAAADFNGDSKPDILWQNTATGERAIWFMNGSSIISGTSLGSVPVEWSIGAAADFNGDGKPDILWQNTTTGERSLWFMDGSTIISGTSLGSVPVEWSIAAAADFNGDGNPDILWQNTTTGERSLWFMNGTSTINGTSLGSVPVEWSIAAAADFNSDGNPDILWQNTATGLRYLWFMNGTTISAQTSLGPVPLDWHVVN